MSQARTESRMHGRESGSGVTTMMRRGIAALAASLVLAGCAGLG